MNKLLPLLIITLPLLLSGCYATLIEGMVQGYDASRRGSLKIQAASDDAVAQYKLGNTYCCQGAGPMHGLSVYDNNQATLWYCKAARQGYGPAQLRLARLYSGQAIRGFHLGLRASNMIGKADTDLSIALMWASIAAENKGVGDADDASELRNQITKKATSKERTKSDTLMHNWQTASCQWAEVFPTVGNVMHSQEHKEIKDKFHNLGSN